MVDEKLSLERYKSEEFLKSVLKQGGVSIIIPLYNAEKYIDRCLTSLSNQTYDNFEIILVDDGSTDNSGIICDKWAQENEKIRVIHQKNSGVSKARMIGLKQAIGEYVAFVDIDDYVDTKYLEILCQDIINEHADVACCDYIEISNGNKTNRFHNTNNYRIITKIEQYLADYVQDEVFYGSVVWGKLIRRSLLSDIEFKSINYGEDTVFMIDFFSKEPLTVLNPYQGYYYIRNEDSATVSDLTLEKKARIGLQHIHIGEALIELSKHCDKKWNEIAAEQYAKKTYAAISLVIKSGKKNLYINNQDYLSRHVDSVLKMDGISLKHTIMLNIYKFIPETYWTIMRIVLNIKGR